MCWCLTQHTASSVESDTGWTPRDRLSPEQCVRESRTRLLSTHRESPAPKHTTDDTLDYMLTQCFPAFFHTNSKFHFEVDLRPSTNWFQKCQYKTKNTDTQFHSKTASLLWDPVGLIWAAHRRMCNPLTPASAVSPCPMISAECQVVSQWMDQAPIHNTIFSR